MGIRDGQVVHLATAETYDFSQQGGIQVQQPTYELESGDSFRTNCFYKHESEAKFGRASPGSALTFPKIGECPIALDAGAKCLSVLTCSVTKSFCGHSASRVLPATWDQIPL